MATENTQDTQITFKRLHQELAIIRRTDEGQYVPVGGVEVVPGGILVTGWDAHIYRGGESKWASQIILPDSPNREPTFDTILQFNRAKETRDDSLDTNAGQLEIEVHYLGTNHALVVPRKGVETKGMRIPFRQVNEQQDTKLWVYGGPEARLLTELWSQKGSRLPYQMEGVTFGLGQSIQISGFSDISFGPAEDRYLVNLTYKESSPPIAAEVVKSPGELFGVLNVKAPNFLTKLGGQGVARLAIKLEEMLR